LSLRQKQALHRKIDKTARDWEPAFEEAADQAFEKDRRALLAILNKAKKAALRLKATVNWSKVQRDWDAYFSQFAGEEWREEFIPMLEGVITDQTDTLNVDFGMQFNVRNLLAETWFEDYVLKFAQDILDTTKGDVSAMLKQAMQNGWTIAEMEKQLDLTWERYTDPNFTVDGRGLTEEEQQWFVDRSPKYRREMIARTETMRASNAGSLNLYRAWGVTEFKEWLATGDQRCRDTHIAAWSRYSEGGSPGPIPLDRPFEVGGAQLMQPGDPSGPPGETINCRCTVLPFTADFAGTPEEIAKERAEIEAEQRRREEEQLAKLPEAERARKLIEKIGKEAQKQIKEWESEIDDLRREYFSLVDQIQRMQEAGFRQELIDSRIDDREKTKQRYIALAGERRKLIEKTNSESRELLYVDSPAQFKVKYSKRAKNYKLWETGIEAFKKMVGIDSLNGREVAIKTIRKRRSFYTQGEDKISLASSAGARTVIHELGHWFEETDSNVLSKLESFYNRRTVGESEEWLGDNYGASERTKRDRFTSPYMGKIYKDRDGNVVATEILSMGMEYMWPDPYNFATTDPDYFDFIYDLLRGK